VLRHRGLGGHGHHGVQHPLRGEAVERPRGLVSQHHGRVVHQRPGNGGALRLAAGHRAGAPVGEVGHSERIQHLERPDPRRAGALAEHL
jgi:hypothetical protein